MLWKAVSAPLSHRGRGPFEVFSRLPFFQIKESNFRPSFSPFDEGELQNWDGRADGRVRGLYSVLPFVAKRYLLCLPAEVFFALSASARTVTICYTRHSAGKILWLEPSLMLTKNSCL